MEAHLNIFLISELSALPATQEIASKCIHAFKESKVGLWFKILELEHTTLNSGRQNVNIIWSPKRPVFAIIHVLSQRFLNDHLSSICNKLTYLVPSLKEMGGELEEVLQQLFSSLVISQEHVLLPGLLSPPQFLSETCSSSRVLSSGLAEACPSHSHLLFPSSTSHLLCILQLSQTSPHTGQANRYCLWLLSPHPHPPPLP